LAKRIALLIANQTFDAGSGLDPLRGPINDVAELAALFSDPERGKYEVQEFLDRTRQEILLSIARVLVRASSEDLVVIYYSGHGKLDRDGHLCLVTSDTQADVLGVTSIPTRDLQRLIDQSRCNQVVLLLDCCYSGAVGEGFKGDVNSELHVVEQARGVFILTASSGTQVAKEIETGEGKIMGQFTAALVSGIKGGTADRSRGGTVVLEDLVDHVRRVLTGQRPEFFCLRAHGHPIIAYSPETAQSSTDPALELISRLRSNATELLDTGRSFTAKDRHEDAIAIYDDLVGRYGTSIDAQIRTQVAKALLEKARALEHFGRWQEKLAIYEDLLQRLGSTPESSVASELAEALYAKAMTLGQLGRGDEAVVIYDDLAERFENSLEGPVGERVAKALFAKGCVHEKLGHREAAFAAYDKLLANFTDSDKTPIRGLVARSLCNRAFLMSSKEESVAAYKDLLVRFGRANETTFREPVIKGLCNMGIDFMKLGNNAAAVETFDELVDRFGSDTDELAQERVATALDMKATALCRLGRMNEAVATHDEILRRYGDRV
jgi:tetratricopeptide (TPR) repeat protein